MPRHASAALLVHATLIQALTFALRPASTYSAIDLGAPASTLGLIGATFAVVPLVLAVPIGTMVDRAGERTLMIVGSLIATASAAAFLTTSESIAGLMVANAALGAGHLCCMIGQQAMVANRATRTRLDNSFGYYTFAASLGQAVGPGLIAVVGGSAVKPDTVPIFWVALAVGGVMTLTALLTAAPARGAERPAVPDGAGLGTLLGTPGLPRALTTSAVILAAVDLTVVYLPALGAERGLTAATVGTLLTVRAVFSMASRLLLGRLAAVMGRTRLMATSIALSATALLGCALPMPTPALVAVTALLGLGLGVGQPLTMSWLTEQTPAGMRGRAMSLRLAGNRVGQVVIPSSLGLVATGIGAAGVMAATAAAVASTGLLLRGLHLDSDTDS